ncbi:MAG: RluA family pseudouridine synthase, partial [Clostridia bacterium]|nr:RluA family pseudouridine synthase [Clostridia bacterium]
MSTVPEIRVIYEDNHLLVVSKPPNMPTQADDSHDPDLLSEMKAYVARKYQKPGAVYLGLVHRLDRPVGGLLVLARTGKAAQRLSGQVQAKTMNREYLAVVRGRPVSGELHDWLLKDPADNMVRVVPANVPGAKEARLSFRVLGSAEGCSLVRVRLYTGRSHQIRVQLSHAGFPIWGDARYGRGRPGEQIALWGTFLTLEHPTRKEEMHFFSPPPEREVPWSAFSSYIQMIDRPADG